MPLGPPALQIVLMYEIRLQQLGRTRALESKAPDRGLGRQSSSYSALERFEGLTFLLSSTYC